MTAVLHLTAARGGVAEQRGHDGAPEGAGGADPRCPVRASRADGDGEHILDVETDSSWGPRLREDATARGLRSVAAVPMLRGGDVVGVITVSRIGRAGLEAAEIALVQTFADQAVIAIENARLFNELGARNKDLTESLERHRPPPRSSGSSARRKRMCSRCSRRSQTAPCGSSERGVDTVFRYDGEFLRLAAARGGLPGSSEPLMAASAGT